MIVKLPKCLTHSKDIVMETHLCETSHVRAEEACHRKICLIDPRRPTRRTVVSIFMGTYVMSSWVSELDTVESSMPALGMDFRGAIWGMATISI